MPDFNALSQAELQEIAQGVPEDELQVMERNLRDNFLQDPVGSRLSQEQFEQICAAMHDSFQTRSTAAANLIQAAQAAPAPAVVPAPAQPEAAPAPAPAQPKAAPAIDEGIQDLIEEFINFNPTDNSASVAAPSETVTESLLVDLNMLEGPTTSQASLGRTTSNASLLTDPFMLELFAQMPNAPGVIDTDSKE